MFPLSGAGRLCPLSYKAFTVLHKGNMTKSICEKPHKAACYRNGELIQKSSFQSSSSVFGAARQHLKRFNSSTLFPAKKKHFLHGFAGYISLSLIFIAPMLMTSLILFGCSALDQKNAASSHKIGRSLINRFSLNQLNPCPHQFKFGVVCK